MKRSAGTTVQVHSIALATLGDEPGRVHQHGSARSSERRIEIGKINTSQRLFEMKSPGFAIQTEPPPIVHSIGLIGFLLDLKKNTIPADGMNAARWQKYYVPGLDFDAMQTRLYSSSFKRCFELFALDPPLQTGVHARARPGFVNVPHLGLWFAAQFFRDAKRRVDLQR